MWNHVAKALWTWWGYAAVREPGMPLLDQQERHNPKPTSDVTYPILPLLPVLENWGVKACFGSIWHATMSLMWLRSYPFRKDPWEKEVWWGKIERWGTSSALSHCDFWFPKVLEKQICCICNNPLLQHVCCIVASSETWRQETSFVGFFEEYIQRKFQIAPLGNCSSSRIQRWNMKGLICWTILRRCQYLY